MNTSPQAGMAGGAIAFRLPNARAGAAYAQRLEPQWASGIAPALDYVRIALPPALGMRADTASGTVSGTPQTAGTFDIDVDFRLAGQPGGAARRATFQFIVTPDPRSLWCDLPSDPGAPYWRPDRDSAAIAAGALRMAAASTRGRSHAHRGELRDDDFCIAWLPDAQWQVAVVADGAGSAQYGRRGAQLICTLAQAHLRDALDGAPGRAIDLAVQALGTEPAARESTATPAPGDGASPPSPSQPDETLRQALTTALGQAAACALQGIEREAAARGEPVTGADYHSTAQIALCKRYPGGTLYAAYWVGDGAIGVYRRGHGVTLLGRADSGEFSGQTRFLTAGAITPPALAQRIHYTIAHDATALVLMTDGVSDAWFDSDTSMGQLDAWDTLWRELAPCLAIGAPSSLLDWLAFWSPGNHDDRTIAIIHQELS